MSNRIEELVTATDAWCDQNFPPDWTERVDEFLPLWNEKFAALVAAAEREACARVCEERVGYWQRDDIRRDEDENCAAAIRARGSK
jgi:hypothetical protein